MLTQMLAKLMVIRAYEKCMSILSTSLVNEFDRGYLKGWEAGCEHAWRSAGMAGPFPWRDSSDQDQMTEETAGALAGEGENADGGTAELEEVSEALATEVATLWEAFSRACRAEMGVEPETILLAWLPPMQGWIEGALNAADGILVDADLLLEYETALTNAWRELLREA
jgi:hypothetical protein